MTWDICPAADLITQVWGCVDNAMEWEAPWCPNGRYHAGVDLGSTQGGYHIFRAPVYATRSGWVVAIGVQYLGDQAVVVETDGGVFMEYGHLDEADVAIGELVLAGGKIGLLGTKGSSSAPHLHLEVRSDGPYQNVNNRAVHVLNPAIYLNVGMEDDMFTDADRQLLDRVFNLLMAGQHTGGDPTSVSFIKTDLDKLLTSQPASGLTRGAVAAFLRQAAHDLDGN